MRSFGLAPISTTQQTSTGTADVKTINVPSGCSAVVLTAETNSARITFDGSTPGAGNGIVLPSGGMPFLIPTRRSSKIMFASVAAANCILDCAFFG